MKTQSFLLWFTCILILIFTHSSWQSAHPQTGNQSDITGPNLQEIFSFPPPEEPANSNQNNNSQPSQIFGTINRQAFENQFIQADFEQAVELFEEFQAVEYAKYFGLQLYGRTVTACEIAQTLDQLTQKTQIKAAIIYTVALQEQLDLLVIFPQNQACTSPVLSPQASITPRPFLQVRLPEVKRPELEQLIDTFRGEISNPRKIRTASYQPYSRALYQRLIEPLESEIQNNQIDTLIFCLDKRLRSIPLSSLYNGQEFLIQKYNVGLIPSFSLIDPGYRSVQSAQILGFGVSDGGKNQELPPLPAVPIELSWVGKIWQGQTFLNQNATLQNLQEYSKNDQIRMMHIATHAEFRPGDLRDSFIQLWDRNIGLNELREISQISQWNQNPRVELLVLSACRTALGSEEAELGFSGLALQAGVKTSMGSLWYASDEGSMALMAEFYHLLQNSQVKTEALRAAQLNMLNGTIRIKEKTLELSDGIRINIPENFPQNLSFEHPYYWSAYTLVGNWN